MTRRFVLIGCFGVFAAAYATAADEALPKAADILDRYVEVTGGKTAYLNHRSEITVGQIDFGAQGLKGTVTRYAAGPDKTYSDMNIDGVGQIELGTNGGVAWEKSSLLGVRVKMGEEKAQALREGTFNAAIQWSKMYSKVETLAIEPVASEDCYKVLLTPATGNPETMYFSKKTGLLMVTTMIAVNQMGEVPVESTVSDYKNFNGILMPTKVREKAAGQEFTITIQSVAINPEIPPTRFDLPAEVKALIAPK